MNLQPLRESLFLWLFSEIKKFFTRRRRRAFKTNCFKGTDVWKPRRVHTLSLLGLCLFFCCCFLPHMNSGSARPRRRLPKTVSGIFTQSTGTALHLIRCHASFSLSSPVDVMGRKSLNVLSYPVPLWRTQFPLCDIEGMSETKSPTLELEPQTFSTTALPQHHARRSRRAALLRSPFYFKRLYICWLIVGSRAARKWSKP